jgi:hypothetical protein
VKESGRDASAELGASNNAVAELDERRDEIGNALTINRLVQKAFATY